MDEYAVGRKSWAKRDERTERGKDGKRDEEVLLVKLFFQRKGFRR